MLPVPVRRSRSRAPRVGAGPLLAAVVLALLAAPVAHASFVGQASDPAGDGAAEGARDIVAAGAGYERTAGYLVAAVALREEPAKATRSLLVGYVARRTATGCNAPPTVGLTATTVAFGGSWMRLDAPPAVAARGDARVTGGSGRVVQLEATDRRMAGLTPNCAELALVDADGAHVEFDRATIDLRPLPNLGLRLSGLPRTVRSGGRHTLAVRVSNPGDAPTGRVLVRLGALRGVTAKRRHVVPSLKPGASRTLRVPVTFDRRARASNELGVTATAGALRATANRVVAVRRPGRRPGSGGGGGSAGSGPSVCTRFLPDLSGESGGSMGLVPCAR